MLLRFLLVALVVLTPSVLHAQADKPSAPAIAPSSDIGPLAHPATEDQIREYLALTGMARAAHNVMATMVNGMRATAAPYYPKAFWDDMESEFQKVDLVAIYVPVYQKYISEEEMRDVLAFYRSRSGQKLLAMQTFLVRDAQDTMRKKGGEIGVTVYARHKDEIEAAKKEFESGPAKPAGPK